MGRERLLKAVTVNNPVSFTPSLWPLMGLRSSVHGTGLFPGFYLAHFCKVPPAVFLAHRFLRSLSKENKNNVSLSVTRSLVAYPSLSSFQSLRSGLLLAPSLLRSSHNFCSQESKVTGAYIRYSAYLPHTVTFWRLPVPPRVPARLHLRSAPPPVGPPGLGLGGSSIRMASLRVFPVSVQGHLKPVFIAPLFETVTWPAHRRVSGKPKTRNLSPRSALPLFLVMRKLVTRGPKPRRVPSAPAGPPPPKPLTPRIPCNKVPHLTWGKGGLLGAPARCACPALIGAD